jgi:hypothetical protein
MCEAPLALKASFMSLCIIPLSPVTRALTIAAVSSVLNGIVSIILWTSSQSPAARQMINPSLSVDVLCMIAALQKQNTPVMNVRTMIHIHSRLLLHVLLDLVHKQAAQMASEGSRMAFMM